MNEKLRQHIESLFADAPQTKQVIEIKEEILQNTIDRYRDLLAEGKTEEAAFNIAVSGIGDINRLLESIGNPNTAGYTREEIEHDRRRSGLLLSIAVMLYILCVIPPILLDQTKYSESLGPVLMFVMIAVATGLIIYRTKTKLPLIPGNGTVVEEFKEWNNKKSEDSALFKSIASAVWAICLVAYFVVSFTTGAWYISWLIFFIAGAVTNIIKACFELRK